MIKDFFIPTASNHYHPIGIGPRFLYTYALFMLIFNLFASRFLVYFPSPVEAQTTYSAQDIISLTNQDRLSDGLSSLSTNSMLMSAAAAKAADMFKYQYWAHYNPTTGASPWSFIAQSGYDYHYAGENLAEGYDSAVQVNTAWLNSSEHRANIMNSNYTDIGVAVVYGTLLSSNVILVVQMFGSLQPPLTITPYPTPPAPTQATQVQGITTTQKPTITPKAIALVSPTSTPIPTPTSTPTILATPPVVSPVPLTHPQGASSNKQNPLITAVNAIQTHVLGIKFTTGVNFLVAVFLLVLFSLDSVFFYRIRNLHSRMKPSSIAHIPLLTILAIICLAGTIGVTL